ncbi:cyclic nucleotide-gated ion channel 1-like isoform X4 [Quercus robur]|uniref:cyclic nucleotide-gated ion channel 1-like isoform X4 n=1 Tax=Quercus robur TaxID=38942 RepID=UPI0021623264|nr:cyclic nucleotide-gated ion channel 1-like isoform X4 [Quercus robur]
MPVIRSSTADLILSINDIEEQAPKVGKTEKTSSDSRGNSLPWDWNRIKKWVNSLPWDWNLIVILVRMIALSLEPLFLYGLTINEYKKCVEIDRMLGITAIVSRTFLDISYLVLRFHTGFLGNLFRKSRKKIKNHLVKEKINGATSRSTEIKAPTGPTPVKDKWQTDLRKYILHPHFLFDILVFLPIPQVLGAFWYCFSIQRTVACWYMACKNHGRCVRNSFYYCDHNFRYHSVLDEFCPKNMPNAELFDFGVYLDAHQSKILESKNIPQKIFYCFCWGMRNLSSFGSNLRTSNDVWENCFVLCVTIFGLLLFLYYMGNFQTSMQRRKRRKRQEANIELWLSKEEVPTEMKSHIIGFIHNRFDEDEDVNVENLIPDLPSELQSNVKRHICLNLLKNLNIIKKNDLTKDQQLLLKICNSLKPVFYNEQSYIVKEGDPIDAVFLITYGIAWAYPSSNNGEGKHAERLEKGHFFGEELLELLWNPSSVDNLSKLPISSKTLKTHTKVEVFALMANDVAAYIQGISLHDQNPVELDVVEYKEASILQRVRCCNQPKCWCFKKTSESSST